MLIIHISNLKVKNIYINGNAKIKDVEIIEIANLKDYPPIFKLNKKEIIEKIKTIPLVENATIKRNIFVILYN